MHGAQRPLDGGCDRVDLDSCDRLSSEDCAYQVARVRSDPGSRAGSSPTGLGQTRV